MGGPCTRGTPSPSVGRCAGRGSKAVLPPVAIVGPCPLSVDAYAAAGREVDAPRPDCPDCGDVMSWWSDYRRLVRSGGVSRAIFVPRVRCGPCAKTDAVLHAFVFMGRLDAVETVGAVVEKVVAAVGGVRPAAAVGRCSAYDGAGVGAPLRGPGDGMVGGVRGAGCRARRRGRWRYRRRRRSRVGGDRRRGRGGALVCGRGPVGPVGVGRERSKRTVVTTCLL